MDVFFVHAIEVAEEFEVFSAAEVWVDGGFLDAYADLFFDFLGVFLDVDATDLC